MILVEEKYDCNDGELNQVFCERQECSVVTFRLLYSFCTK